MGHRISHHTLKIWDEDAWDEMTSFDLALVQGEPVFVDTYTPSGKHSPEHARHNRPPKRPTVPPKLTPAEFLKLQKAQGQERAAQENKAAEIEATKQLVVQLEKLAIETAAALTREFNADTDLRHKVFNAVSGKTSVYVPAKEGFAYKMGLFELPVLEFSVDPSVGADKLVEMALKRIQASIRRYV